MAKKQEIIEDSDEHEIRHIPQDAVVKAARHINSYKADMDKARGELGQIYKQFEEDGGHKKAFKDALKMQNMEPISAQEYWRSLNQYMKDLGIFDQMDMFDPVPGQVAAPLADATIQ